MPTIVAQPRLAFLDNSVQSTEDCTVSRKMMYGGLSKMDYTHAKEWFLEPQMASNSAIKTNSHRQVRRKTRQQLQKEAQKELEEERKAQREENIKAAEEYMDLMWEPDYMMMAYQDLDWTQDMFTPPTTDDDYEDAFRSSSY